ncbi:hypothetical protein BpHYR1_045740 [Brachionus plicatilis]|uniref:Uncharacterized protein n=1 Tax=Brachionus plicatilis TaxID=10195 RepID=A0A3M7Q5C4_BRAPC|nr:hypothetical protein BpHYR1_045740 [Brachionus plicatilis]
MNRLPSNREEKKPNDFLLKSFSHIRNEKSFGQFSIQSILMLFYAINEFSLFNEQCKGISGQWILTS